MSEKKKRSGKTFVWGILLICAAAVWFLIRPAIRSAEGIPGGTDAERVSYIESFGWRSSGVPVKVQEIRIPVEFDDAYNQYNALQREQGFDLRKYRAHKAKKYTYKITNYDGADPAVPICANLIVADGEIIGADISSSEANGLVTVLAKK